MSFRTPKQMQNTFTFITDFRGGTYISQVKANDVDAAVISWVEQLKEAKNSIKHLREKTIAQIYQEAQDQDHRPGALEGVKNVWCTSFATKTGFLLVNIVQTHD
jgi:hypothetical protein